VAQLSLTKQQRQQKLEGQDRRHVS